MKLYEVLLEDKKQVQEAPMGMLNTLGNKAMAKMGSARATGKLSTGALANQLHKEFQTYLGKTGREATKDAVMGFLSSKGYPTQGAATIINTALKGAANAPAGPLANMKNTARGLVGKAKDAMVKQAGNIADKLKPGLTSAPINKTEPTMGDETPTTTAPADTTSAAPAKTGSSYNNQLGGGQATYNRSTGFDRNTMKNTSEPLDPKAVGGVPSTTNPTTAPKQFDPRDLNKNGEVDATEKSIARNKGKKKPAATTVSASKINTGNMVAEAGPGVLPQNIIDKAILKAAQEAEIMNTKQGKTSTQQTKSANLSGGAPTDTDGDIDATDTAKSSGGGFAAGLKKGFTGKPAATPDLAGLEQRIAAIEKKVGLA
jgi:hypothetical protein